MEPYKNPLLNPIFLQGNAAPKEEKGRQSLQSPKTIKEGMYTTNPSSPG
jgi:hypothetical protein